MKQNTHTNTICSDLQEIFYTKFQSRSRSKLYTLTQMVPCLEPPTAVYFSILHLNPTEAHFYNILSHLKTLNYVALVSLQGSLIASPPCCYYRPTKLRHLRVIPCNILRFTFCSYFIILTRKWRNYMDSVCCLIEKTSNLELCRSRISYWAKV
jgi:hypothetical protein